MAQAIFIVGGLKNDPDSELLLRELRDKAGKDVEWEWYQALACDYYLLARGRLFDFEARFKRKVASDQRPTVVKLYLLHGRTQKSIYNKCHDPVIAPKELDSVEKLAEWLLSAEAGLVPQREWLGNAQETAIVAILAKLIKNKSWNKDTQGHAWTKEVDLLGQAPVTSPKRTEVQAIARKLLPDLKGKLLICKGGTHGGTPKEWSILLSVLTTVKQAILSQSIARLADVPQTSSIIGRASKDEDRCYSLREEVVSERVRQICRDRTE